MNIATSRSAPAALALATLLAPACGVHVGGHSKPVLHESEPNDLAAQADFLGWLEAGVSLDVVGSIAASPFDPYDGFAFVSAEPIELRFRLYAEDPGADLDLCVYDPVGDELIACYESPFDPEEGAFGIAEAGVELHLVVSAFSGASDYVLELDVLPLPYGVEAAGARALPPSESAPARDRGRYDAYRGRAAAADEEPLGAPALWIEIDPESGVLREHALRVAPGRVELVGSRERPLER
jgi:hypothetical protein